MFCQSCGYQISDGSKFCNNCGTTIVNAVPPQQVKQPVQQPNNTAPQQSTYSTPKPDAAPPQQPVYTAPKPQTTYTAPQQNNNYQFNNTGEVQELPMKWYKFVIYFQLFASAVSNLIGLIMCFTGAHYGGGYMTDLVYSYYDGLRGFDIFMGICCIPLIASAIYTRFRLSAFRKDAIFWLFMTYGANVVFSLIYLIGVSSIIQNFDASQFSPIVGNASLLVCSSVYFNKRKHLFVN